MKKIVAVGLIALAGLSLTGCDADETGRVVGDTENFTRDAIVVGGEKFDCIFESRNHGWATMSCEFAGDARGQQDTDGFTREVITVGGEKFDCIFESRNHGWATMSCDPLQK